ncbi:class I SAM-dependent methyltransferase [uncultured Jatrophihabitans sp.]|uniref:class I SAM-dependent methyltransferase n=1 Tax=uncultured Jatrophihabitans sp. TaxID=1610747 RepID=UPI0035C984E3
MSDAMDDEFDTLAGWTADAVDELGPEYAIPAGCRGSGGPAALGWLLEHLAVTASDRMLDAGAGVGGPAAFAVQRTGVTVVLAEPEPEACRAARHLYDLEAVVAPGQDLPFGDDAFDVAWSLAVLCTTEDKDALLGELHRVLAPAGRLGLLVYVRTTDDLSGGPEGNVFPSDDELAQLLDGAGFDVTGRQDVSDLPPDDEQWTQRGDAIDDVLERRHGDDAAWQTAQRQTEAFGGLLSDGRVMGRLVTAARR